MLGGVAILAWMGAVGAGIERIWNYASTPGMSSSAPRAWPGSSLISPHAGRATLVMFVHPRCSCTRASLQELQGILNRSRAAPAVWILLLDPLSAGSDWDRTPIADAARRIGNATVVTDAVGAEAARFGASTSGHVVIYDSSGRLQFSGGITGARGHVGDNDGRRSVLTLLRNDQAHLHRHPVFGCGFHDPEPRS